MTSVFRLLFKYPPLVFEQGNFAFAASRTVVVAIVLGAAVALAALTSYRSVATGRDRTILFGLRAALVAVLALCLLRPSLILKAAVPQQNFLGILLDDSRSMSIADRDGRPRSAFIEQQLAQADSPLLSALSQRFVLRFFRFSASADRVPQAAGLTFDGTASRLGPALERARDELAGLPLAGLVMVSDGADTSDEALDDSLASLKARSIPVFTVGVGQERFTKDIEVSRVETPRTILMGTTVAIDVVVTQHGYAGQTVPLQVEDDGRIVGRQTVTLPADGESTTVRVTITAADAGARLLRFKVPEQPDEQVTANNRRDMMVEVADRRERILYLEGEPRFEAKFVRRAVEDDKNLQVVILQRTAEDKYLRLDVGSPDELVGGFPKTREELFAYRAVILGSVEAASFSPEQLRMLSDFVSKRGGGLLMLGGRRSFAEGGWAGTPVAEVLPVDFDATREAKSSAPFFVRLNARPTKAGATYPVTQLADDEAASTKKWGDMPEVTAVNNVQQVKPGATVLLTGTGDKRQQQIVLAYQKYGRGKAIAFPVQDSWVWRMDAKMAVTDTTHATFWRRLIRWLVEGVPDQVMLSTAIDRVEPGEPLKLSAQVVDPAFADVNDAQVTATITSPSGKIVEVPMEWTVSRDGEYRASIVAGEPGIYEMKATATRGGTEMGAGTTHARAAAGDSEYFDAGMRAPLLKRMAEDTGGRFFTSADVASLPEAINYSGRGVTVVEERDLWDMPIVLLVLIALIGAEWGYRRKQGLA